MDFLAGLSGCSSSSLLNTNNQEQTLLQEEAVFEGSKAIAELYRDIYEQAVLDETLGMDTIKEIVHRLGENGYAVVDNENQIDMVNPGRQYCGRKL